jgi:GPH family glycoside/pentoside/hexuronide:cation symporter
MTSVSDTQISQLDQSEPTDLHNSPIAYGLGSFGLEAAFKVFVGFYMFFYVDTLGLVIALAAIINVIYALWDAVNDPLVGYLSDNTRTRWGRRKPWILTALPFYVIFLVLIYAVPDMFQGGILLFWYALVVILLFENVNTIININYEALFPELFQGFKERTRASAYNQGFGMVGELVGFALTPIIYTQFGFVPTAVFFALMAGILVFFSLMRNREDPNAQKAPPLNLKGAFGDVLHDRPFWQFTIVATLLWFTTGVYTLATPFWTKYTLQASPQAPSIIFAAVFLVAIASVSLWSRLVRRWGTKQTGYGQ